MEDAWRSHPEGAATIIFLLMIGYNIRDAAFRFTAQPGTVRDSADPLPLSTTSAYSTAQGRQSH